MRILKTRTFARWSRTERISDSALAAAVDEMRRIEPLIRAGELTEMRHGEPKTS